MITKLTHEEISRQKPAIGAVKKAKKIPFYVVLDNIRSIYNVGALFRTCDAISACEIILCGITGYPPRKDLEKTALGATEVVKWSYSPSARETLLKLKKKGVNLCALELAKESLHYRKAKYGFPMALVLGNEVDGISDDLMPLMDTAVSIPMLGRANSLNVTTAFGIVGYEILWQYQKRNEKK
jgi:tRNA G18 (ribose-2'-O)-methylase SpoU